MGGGPFSQIGSWNPEVNRLQRHIASMQDNQQYVQLLGHKRNPLSDLVVDVAYRASRACFFVQEHVQSTESGKGGIDYDANNFVSSTRVDVRQDRRQETSVTMDGTHQYYLFLVPVFLEPDGTYTKFDGVDAENEIAFLELGTAPMNFAYAVAKGLVTGTSALTKFGRNPDVDTGTDPEDIWDGGGVWVAPTQARVHTIATTSTNDDFSDSGSGARTIRIYGLTDWDTAEVNEDIELDGNGTNNVQTANSYVIIHRMQVLTAGTGGSNAGTITATANTDGTVTAQINVGNNQTLMAIYGVPSVRDLYLTQYYMDVNKSGAAGTAAVRLLINEAPDDDLDLFLVKHHLGLTTAGTSHITHSFEPYNVVSGPALVKLSVHEVSQNDMDVSGGFYGYMVT